MKQNFNNIFILLICLGISVSSWGGIEDIFDGHTSLEEPFKLRDPFKSPLPQKVIKNDEVAAPKKVEGVYTNVEELGIVDLANLKVTGVLIGRDRRAILAIKDKKDPFIIKEGAKLGKSQAEVRAIVPGGLILVEKVTNIYGEVEYLETVIPISK